eukprot:1429533-Rhodomonas_salina.1
MVHTRNAHTKGARPRSISPSGVNTAGVYPAGGTGTACLTHVPGLETTSLVVSPGHVGSHLSKCVARKRLKL